MNKSAKLSEKLSEQLKVDLIRKLRWQLSRECFVQISNQLDLPLEFQIGERLETTIYINLWSEFVNE